MTAGFGSVVAIGGFIPGEWQQVTIAEDEKNSTMFDLRSYYPKIEIYYPEMTQADIQVWKPQPPYEDTLIDDLVDANMGPIGPEGVNVSDCLTGEWFDQCDCHTIQRGQLRASVAQAAARTIYVRGVNGEN